MWYFPSLTFLYKYHKTLSSSHVPCGGIKQLCREVSVCREVWATLFTTGCHSCEKCRFSRISNRIETRSIVLKKMSAEMRQLCPQTLPFQLKTEINIHDPSNNYPKCDPFAAPYRLRRTVVHSHSFCYFILCMLNVYVDMDAVCRNLKM